MRLRLFLPLLLAAVTVSGCQVARDVAAVVEDGITAPVPGELSADPMPCQDGRAGAFGCSNVDMVSRVPVDGFPGSSRGNDIWGWTDAATGVEYALVGLDDGTGFVSLADPERPAVLGKLPTTTEASTWRDIKTYADHAYIGSEAPGHGVQVFDLSRLRGLAADPARVFDADALYTGVGSSHNVVIDEQSGFLYAVGAVSVGDALPAACDAKGFHAIDIREPQSPTFAGCFSDAAQETGPRTPGYTHDAQCLVYDGPDADYRGRQVCLAANEDVLTLFDVEDKSDVKLIAIAAYPGEAYSHQVWLSEDQRYAFLNDELDEMNGNVPTQRTLVFDLMDLDNPEFDFAWDSGLPVIDHNLYVKDGYLFQSNYMSGLRIVDAARVSEGILSEAAFFDTFPQGEKVGFGGQWSNFPYFQSGLVVANDGKNGLFVLRPTLDRLGS